MIKKLLLMAALGAMLALAIVVAGGTPAKANPGGLQDFDLDIADCLVASYPPAIGPSPDPSTGPYQVCANSPAEDKGLGPRSTTTPGYALTTAIGLDGGNRVGLPYVYNGPGWGLKSDAEITDTTPVADIIAISDLFANGIGDVLADPSNCSGGSCDAASGTNIVQNMDGATSPLTVNIDDKTGLASLTLPAQVVVESEQMTLTALTGDGPGGGVDTMTVTRPAPAAHTQPKPVVIRTVLNFTNAVGLPYLEQTTAWGTTSGCPGTGGDESSLTLVTPGSSAMSRYVRWRACIGTEFLNSYFRYNLPVPAPLNLVFFHPNWSPAGTHVNLVSLATSVDAPTTSLTTLDTPQGSLTSVRAPYADNPVAPGLYARWSTELSNPDGRNAAVNFMYSTNCKAIGGAQVDADADCLPDTAVDPGWGVAGPGAAQAPPAFTNTHLGPPANRLDATFNVTLGGTITGAAVTGEPAACTALGAGARTVELSNNTVIVFYTANCVPSPGGSITLTVSTSLGGVATTGAVVWHTVDTNPSPTTGFDTDSDGLLDGVEWAWGSDPSLANTDADGRTDLEEMIGPTQLLTDPTKADTDGDTVLDGGYKVDLYDTPSTGCQTSGNPDGKPDFPDENGDSICDSGMSANQDPLNGITDGSSHVRVGFAVIKEIPLDGLDWDNCPSTPNADQKNTDFDSVGSGGTGLGNGDLYGDACDGDDDNDEMADGAELTNGYNAVTGQCTNDGSAVTNPLNPDSDGDTVLDGVECFLGKNPASAASKPAPATSGDADKDGLTSGFETYQRSQNFSDQRAPRPVGNEDVDLDQGGSGSACDLAGNCGGNDFDSDNDGLWDSCEAIHTGTSLLRADTDGDTVLDRDEPNASSTVGFTEIGNGASIATPDVTVPSSAYPFDCDNDADNDGKPDADDADPAPGQPVDVTYDDDGDGMSCIPTGGGDPTDTGPSWDANCNAKLDGKEASCPLATNPTGDDDGDGLLNTWEVCKWGTNPNIVDSDGDGKGDCIEACDTDGNGLCGFGDDALNSARATLLPAGTGTGKFGKDGDFDLNGNNLLSGDFGNDTIRTAQYAFKILACK
jgi:hypothetical protein